MWYISTFPRLCEGQQSFLSGPGENEEVIVSFKTLSDHMDGVSSLDMETLATGCDETKTLFHPQRCSKSRLGKGYRPEGLPGSKTSNNNSLSLCSKPIRASLNTYISHAFHRKKHWW